MKFLSKVFFLGIISSHSFAQNIEKVSGVVIDRLKQKRLAQVYIENVSRKQKTFSDLHGIFTIMAQASDTLLFAHPSFFNDTIILKTNTKSLICYLYPNGKTLQEVRVVAPRIGSKESIKNTLKENAKAIEQYQRNEDLISVGNIGAGISIEAIYQNFSKEGQDLRELQKVIRVDYEARVVEEHFSKELVARVTRLQGEELSNFIYFFKPSYTFVMTHSTYELIKYIQRSYTSFKICPAVFKPLKLSSGE